MTYQMHPNLARRGVHALMSDTCEHGMGGLDRDDQGWEGTTDGE